LERIDFENANIQHRKTFEPLIPRNTTLTIGGVIEAIEGILLCSALFNSYLKWKLLIKEKLWRELYCCVLFRWF